MISLRVFGDPAPQGSKKVVRGRLIEASKKLKPWRAAIEKACQPYANENIHLGPVRLEVDFYLPRPASVKTTGKNARLLPIVPPDCDKLVRAVGDGIGQSGYIWGDDSQVVEILARKFYADNEEPGALIKIIFL